MKKIYFTALFILMILWGNCYALDVSKSFFAANFAYEAGEYSKAAELYELVLLEVKNSHLYYNLANSYFKQGEIGHALVNYLRAKKYEPSDGDINDNINYLRTLTKDKIENKDSFGGAIYRIFFYYDAFNLKVLLIIFFSFNALFFLLLTVKLFTRTAILNWLKNIVLILLILSAAGVALNYKVNFYDKRGVIIGNEVSVRSGCSLNDTVMFNLHEGAEFCVIDENEGGDWIKIKLPDNKKGWIPKEFTEMV